MEKFHYTLPDGYQITLPKMEDIEAGVMRKTRKLNQADQVFTMLEKFLTEDELEQHVDKLTRAGLNDLMEAWRKESNLGVGES